eukprot:XP_001699972.1 predicted protein [Chlamydomonas reinhardtii]
MADHKATSAAGSDAEVFLSASEDESVQQEITPELLSALVKQVEFYFSDANLPTDKKLLKQIRKDPDGFVPVKLFANFRKVRALSKDVAIITEALRNAKLLQLSEDGKRVKRLVAVPDYDISDIQRRTIVVENLPALPSPTIESVTDMFRMYGRVKLVRICSRESKGKLPSWLTSSCQNMQGQHAYVEFEDEEGAVLAAAALAQEYDAPDGAVQPPRLNIYRPPAKRLSDGVSGVPASAASPLLRSSGGSFTSGGSSHCGSAASSLVPSAVSTPTVASQLASHTAPLVAVSPPLASRPMAVSAGGKPPMVADVEGFINNILASSIPTPRNTGAAAGGKPAVRKQPAPKQLASPMHPQDAATAVAGILASALRSKASSAAAPAAVAPSAAAPAGPMIFLTAVMDGGDIAAADLEHAVTVSVHMPAAAAPKSAATTPAKGAGHSAVPKHSPSAALRSSGGGLTVGSTSPVLAAAASVSDGGAAGSGHVTPASAMVHVARGPDGSRGFGRRGLVA